MQYSKKVIQHFTKPKNRGRIKNPSGVGVVGNPVCGDLMKIYIQIEKGIIKDIKFETLGCAAAIATSSMVTELARGKSVGEAEMITRKSVAESLEGLPPIKMHCSNLAAEALRQALDNYKNKKIKIK